MGVRGGVRRHQTDGLGYQAPARLAMVQSKLRAHRPPSCIPTMQTAVRSSSVNRNLRPRQNEIQSQKNLVQTQQFEWSNGSTNSNTREEWASSLLYYQSHPSHPEKTYCAYSRTERSTAAPVIEILSRIGTRPYCSTLLWPSTFHSQIVVGSGLLGRCVHHDDKKKGFHNDETTAFLDLQ